MTEHKSKIEPGPRNKAAISAAAEEWRDRPTRAAVAFDPNEAGTLCMGAPHTDVAGWAIQLANALGTASTDFTLAQVSALEVATRPIGGVSGGHSRELNAALAIVQAVKPTDELEGALAVQMAQCHALSSEMAGRAARADDLERAATYSNLAIKFQRTFTAQVEALARMRGKGQQTVRVEHVTVEAGAQAIVGDVHHHAPGRGTASNQKDQPRGAHPSEERAALPCPDPARDGVPVPRHAKRALSHSRRKVAGRAEGQ